MAGFALLALPAATNPLRDFDMRPRVEIVLATGRTVQQVTVVQTADMIYPFHKKDTSTASIVARKLTKIINKLDSQIIQKWKN